MWAAEFVMFWSLPYVKLLIVYFCVTDSKRDIAESNFMMHEMHCARNIALCERCNEPFPKSEMAEHVESTHSKVNCELCKIYLEKCELESHKVNALEFFNLNSMF